MAITYTEATNSVGQTVIRRNNEDGTISTIPMDESNSDYQAYLEEQANDQSL
jgi:hypothetical protein